MTYTALSLGWGVQSFTLAAMVALGELPPVDVAIHADTTHERSATYEFAERWTPWLEQHGVKVATVQAEDTGVFDKHGALMIPAYVDNGREFGISSRQCTTKWKRAPVRKYLQEHRDGASVELWLGISTDEALRMKDSDVKYITHRWPLIDMRMSRKDCAGYLKALGIERPVKSACYFCPYHWKSDWREMKINAPDDFGKAVSVDNSLRETKSNYKDKLLLFRGGPLDQVDLRNDVDRGQLSLWNEECEGLCGI